MERNIKMRRGQGLFLAALIACMTGCEQNVQSPVAGSAPANDGADVAKDAHEARMWAPLPVEDQALKLLLGDGMKGTAASSAPKGFALAKSAAQTCLIDFNNTTSLSAIADHAYALYAVYPWYQQYCGAHVAMVSPTQGPQYYLVPTESNVCTGSPYKMGYGTYSSCLNQKDAALFPRKAGLLSSSDAQVGLAINDISGGYYRTFSLKSLNVSQGPVYIYGYKNGSWIYWGPLSAGFYNIGLGDNLGQAQIRTADGSGQFLVDNITIVGN